MTWLTTWPDAQRHPVYAVHPTEAAAEAHAKWLIDSNAAKHATAFELTDLPAEENQQ